MPEIQVDIIDTMGNISTLSLPNDAPIDKVTESVVALADVTPTDENGRALSYRLFSRRFLKILRKDGTLYTNGVMEGDQLRIAPEPFEPFVEFTMLTDPEKGAVLTLPPIPRIAIGRGSENDIVIRHPIVSRQHGELIWQDGIHIYRDLNSANGSYINNQPVTEPLPLSINSVLSMGESVRILYRESSATAAKLATGELPMLSIDTQVNTSLTPLPRAGLFISYVLQEKDLTEPVVQGLREANFHVFWEAEIPVGSNPEEAIERNLKYSDAMVVILTPEATTTPRLIEQWNRFIIDRKPIVVLQHEDARLPGTLSDQKILPYPINEATFNQELTAAILEIIR
jgi:pSer/pThr/pTyr-binding forkhead associated (FHA) protein